MDDIIVELAPPAVSGQASRTIRVPLQQGVNFANYRLSDSFQFNTAAISSVTIDPVQRDGVIVVIRNSIVFNGTEDEVAINYSAISSADQIYGRIVFPNLDFDISAAPIEIELDGTCSLPDKIVIDVREYNNANVVLDSVGSNISAAATITVSEVGSSDYNDDYNDDFGADAHGLIIYTLNKATDFWKTYKAKDKFLYTISYAGKTASNYITIKLK